MKLILLRQGPFRDFEDFPAGSERSVSGALRLRLDVPMWVTDDEVDALLVGGVPFRVMAQDLLPEPEPKPELESPAHCPGSEPEPKTEPPESEAETPLPRPKRTRRSKT